MKYHVSTFYYYSIISFGKLKAQSIVEVLEKKAGALKTVRTIQEATEQVRALRQDLSVRPCARDATPDEVQAIIKTIVTTEIASLLSDGAYDFQFNKTAYQLPIGALEDRERIHYGYIFCLVRTTHLLALNPLFNCADVTTMLGRDVLSRHMPTWMKDIFGTNLKNIDWLEWVKPYLNIKDFALTKVRQQERIEDQGTRKTFKLTVTSQNLDDAAESHREKGLPFDRSACLQPGNYTFDAYAISPDGACAFYGCQGPYGYYKRGNFGEQIIDNLDSDPYLQDLVKDSILKGWLAAIETPSHFVKEVLNKAEIKDTAEALFVIFYKSLGEDTPVKIAKQESLMKEIKKKLILDDMKKVITTETNSFFKIAFGYYGCITYVDIIAYLNSINIYKFSREDHTLKFFSFQTHVAYKRSRTTFLLTGGESLLHTTRLVLRDESLASLFEYIKAKEHEKRYRVSIITWSSKCL